jgi:Ca2+:H+ antiporter
MQLSAMLPNSSLHSPPSAGLYDVVKASIVGSIIGNVLLVLGAAMLAGGLRHREQRFNAAAARSQATMLVLAAIALILPAYFQSAVGTTTTQGLDRLSVSISIVLLLAYLLNLVFALVTHRALFAGSYEPDEGKARPSKARAISVLAGATVGIAWMSEILVGTIEPATDELGLSKVFVGVFVVAVMGNAVEHATAIFAAMKDRMDLSLSIAIGSSVQVARAGCVYPCLNLQDHCPKNYAPGDRLVRVLFECFHLEAGHVINVSD